MAISGITRESILAAICEFDEIGRDRYYPMLGFGNFESASRFCTTFDEVHNYFREKGSTSSAERRSLFMSRWRDLIKNVSAA